jgi:hypothetical protein
MENIAPLRASLFFDFDIPSFFEILYHAAGFPLGAPRQFANALYGRVAPPIVIGVICESQKDGHIVNVGQIGIIDL